MQDTAGRINRYVYFSHVVLVWLFIVCADFPCGQRNKGVGIDNATTRNLIWRNPPAVDRPKNSQKTKSTRKQSPTKNYCTQQTTRIVL